MTSSGGRLLLLLILFFSPLSSCFTIDLSTPSRQRWLDMTRSLISTHGADQLVADITAAHDTVPASVLLGLAPLAHGFMETFKHSKVEELQGIVDLLNEGRVEPVLHLKDLVTLNLFTELAPIFQSSSEGVLFNNSSSSKAPLITVSFTEAGKLVAERDGVFGYVGEVPQHMLAQILERSDDGQGMMDQFMKHATRMLGGLVAAELHVNDTSRCTMTPQNIRCSHEQARLRVGLFKRSVLWQVPLGTAPPEGWPVVLHFQGSLFAPHVYSWDGDASMGYGIYEQTKGIMTLLDAGYAVITPETHFNGFTFWDTNIPPFSLIWALAPDNSFMEAMLKEIANPNGLFGHLNNKRKYATGISSGGYMTSRMAVSYAGEFRSLVIAAGSYATCAGPICLVPRLPQDHPPTLFLHGGSDSTVPPFTMEMYYDALVDINVPTEKYIDPRADHQWVDGSAERLLDWFKRYP